MVIPAATGSPNLGGLMLLLAWANPDVQGYRSLFLHPAAKAWASNTTDTSFGDGAKFAQCNFFVLCKFS